MIDATHDAALRSWVPGANEPGDFPIQNLPLGVFSPPGGGARCGIAIGTSILDLSALPELAIGDATIAGRPDRARQGPCGRRHHRVRHPSVEQRRRPERAAAREQDEAAIVGWIGHWITAGFDAVERLIGDDDWCFGPEPGMADVYLIPQIYAARRFGVPIGDYARISRVAALAERHSAFIAAEPEKQPDAG